MLLFLNLYCKRKFLNYCTFLNLEATFFLHVSSSNKNCCFLSSQFYCYFHLFRTMLILEEFRHLALFIYVRVRLCISWGRWFPVKQNAASIVATKVLMSLLAINLFPWLARLSSYCTNYTKSVMHLVTT